MIGLSVCSGIGAAEHAAPWIDWRYQSEIDPFAAAVLRERFPDAVNLGDMTKSKEWQNATIDVLCGGTPCQSFSVAGLRKGLDDPRGNLMLTYLAIADRYKPRWIVWENVPGVLSSGGGRDFASFLGGLGQLGYGWAYRVLDVQYGRTLRFPWAIPQRRRRVFVVGYLGDWRRAAEVLLERESLSRHPPPRREAGQGTAPTLAARARGGGGLGTDFDLDGGLVANSLRAEGFDASEGGTGRQNLVPVCHDVAATINAAFGDKMGLENQHIDQGCPNFIAFDCKGSQVHHDGGGASPTLWSMAGAEGHANGGGQLAVAIQERAVSENPNAGSGGCGVNDDGAAYTLEARITTQAVAFDLNQITNATNRSKPDPAVHHIFPASSCPPHLATPWSVRRLTPVECERLMGFPDNWTQIPWRGKPAEQCPDGRRYKAIGNSWGVNAGEYIFDRMRWVESL